MADKEPTPKKGNQIIGALTATLGGFSLGTVIGWSSPSEGLLVVNKSNDSTNTVSATQWTHVTSVMCLGAMAAQLFLAFTLDRWGHKVLMIILGAPFAAMWFIMAFMTEFVVLLIGRFVLGFCGGSFCVIAPSYIGEIAQPSIRGALGILFQMLLVTGICLQFAMAYTGNIKWLCIPAAIPPAVVVIVMVFLPTSPAFLIKKGKEEKARKALTFFRGKNYDISPDYQQLQDYVDQGQGNFKENMKKKSSKKGFAILLVLHILQQLGGINAVMFYAATIFEELGANGKHCNLGLGLAQLAACLVVAFIVDKLGRKPLWITSLVVMAVSLLLCAIYYFVEKSQPDVAHKIIYLPVVAIIVYVCGFNVAAGPLPWAMIGEYLPAGVKTVTGPLITAINWGLAYAVTFLFPHFVKWAGGGPVFSFFTIVNALGVVFVLFFLLETKNKTLDQITAELG